MNTSPSCYLLVIGGGIIGVRVARDVHLISLSSEAPHSIPQQDSGRPFNLTF